MENAYPKIPLGKAKDLSQQKFIRITPLYRSQNRGNKTAWVCQCDCGSVFVTTADHLIRSHTQSCGCYQKEQTSASNSSDVKPGQKYNRLTVIERANKTKKSPSDRNVYWICQCDCGNLTITSAKYLRSGHTSSCGCSRGDAKALDLTEQKFGMLTAKCVDREKTNSMTGRYWLCKCECGNITSVRTSHLTSGLIQTCGCQKMSHGELKIRDILLQNSISFEQEKTFSDCKNSKTNKSFRYDFFVDKKYLIEFHGIQHYQDRDSEIFTDTLEEIQERDAQKIKWAKENNIPLIVIPYSKYNTLSLEDLLLETSQFLIKD